MKLISVFGFELHLGKFGTYFVKLKPGSNDAGIELPNRNVLNLLGRGETLRFWVDETLKDMDAQDTAEGKMKAFQTYEDKLRTVNLEALPEPEDKSRRSKDQDNS